jgi:hypothetical protein
MKIIKLENGLFKMKFNNAEVTLNATETLAGAWDSYIQLQKFFSEINAAKSEATKSKAPVKVEPTPEANKPTAEPKPKSKVGRTEIMFDLLGNHESLTPAEMMEKAGIKDDNLKFWSSIALRAVQAKKLKRRKLKDGGFTYSLKPSKG